MKVENTVFSRSESLKIMLYALLIGVLAGAISIIFSKLLTVGIMLIQRLLAQNKIFVLVVPAVVYLLFLLSNRYFKITNQTFGVQAVEYELLEIDRQLMKPQAVIVKFINTIITLSCGLAVGQFGPTVHLGGAIGSNIGYYFKFSKKEIRVLIGCGVAAAISSVMQTPLFATIFVVEVIFAKRYFDYMLPVLLASLVAYFLNFNVIGTNHIVNFANFRFELALTTSDWLYLVIFAIGLGLVAALYVFSLNFFESWFEVLKHKKAAYLILVVGFAIVYYSFPQAHFTTPEKIIALAEQSNGLIMLLLLLVVRILLTGLQLGSGLYGGNFSPAVLVGVIFGVITNMLCSNVAGPQLTLQNWLTFSLVGIISGFAYAPLAAIILAVELTADGSIVIPALVVAFISYFVFDLLIDEGVYSLENIDSVN